MSLVSVPGSPPSLSNSVMSFEQQEVGLQRYLQAWLAAWWALHLRHSSLPEKFSEADFFGERVCVCVVTVHVHLDSFSLFLNI